MLALLKLIPGKDFIYGGLIAALLVAFGCYTLHERSLGAAKVLAADKRAIAAAQVHDSEVQSAAQTKIDAAVAAYAAAHAAPLPPAPVLVCHEQARAPSVPSHAGAPAASHGGPAVPAESDGPPFNPAPAVIADGRDADAQVKLLQAYIAACQSAGICAK